MEINEAAEMLITTNGKIFEGIQVWADLGCGTGTFTLALATLLQPGSIIHAIDENSSALHQIPSSHNNVKIDTKKIEFVHDDLQLKNLDGILIANALHYVKDKKSFISKLIDDLKPGGCFLVVEYETEIPVKTWVPYPINFAKLKELFADSGHGIIQKLHERKSVYGPIMYSALLINN
ncbi:MAG TPA: class I SAM-dependent methyltransferase [Puia sp.]|nr:class I SAM-dependent methyltransferase [Puia sp.]